MQPAAADDAATFVAALRATAAPVSFRHTRWVFLRALGFIYVIAFAILFEFVSASHRHGSTFALRLIR